MMAYAWAGRVIVVRLASGPGLVFADPLRLRLALIAKVKANVEETLH